MSNCSAEQHASVQPMTPLENDETTEGISGTSATMKLNGVGCQVNYSAQHLSCCFSSYCVWLFPSFILVIRIGILCGMGFGGVWCEIMESERVEGRE